MAPRAKYPAERPASPTEAGEKAKNCYNQGPVGSQAQDCLGRKEKQKGKKIKLMKLILSRNWQNISPYYFRSIELLDFSHVKHDIVFYRLCK